MASNGTFGDLMGAYGHRVLRALNAEYYDGHGPNPITEAIRAGRGDELVNGTTGGSEIHLSIAATCCQMMKFNRDRGPEGDGKPKALRRHWYAWYKAEFAQPLALALGQFGVTSMGVRQIDDRKWSSLISKTYGRLVATGQVTYQDLWVEDASRMMRGFMNELIRGLNVAVAVEKDSLFGDFVAAARALGAKALISGKGKQSKAATEKMLRDHFGWSEDWNRFSRDQPLRVITISDYDYDGEAVIGPTFGTQARRYTPHVREARIGIKPAQVPEDEWESRSYNVKVSHKGSQDWAEGKALHSAGCESCGYQWIMVGTYILTCPECGGDYMAIAIDENQPAGFEVEALTTREFYPYFVNALLELIPFAEIIDRLREECQPDTWQATDRVTDELLQENDEYQRVHEEMGELQDRLDAFRQRVHNHVMTEAEEHRNDYRDEGDDPVVEDFQDHVREADDYAEPWRPFSRATRTDLLADDLLADDTVREALKWSFE